MHGASALIIGKVLKALINMNDIEKPVEKAVESSIQEVGKTAREFLGAVLIEPLSQVGLLASDQISFWRFKNQVNLIEKAKKFLEGKGIKPESLKGTVQPHYIVPLIEAGQNTSDEILSDIFARLLATALDPETKDKMHPSFIKIISELSPEDAVVLDIYNNNYNAYRIELSQVQEVQALGDMKYKSAMDFKTITLESHLDEKVSKECLINLLRLNIFVQSPFPELVRKLKYGGDAPTFDDLVNYKEIRFEYSEYGKRFVRACYPDMVII